MTEEDVNRKRVTARRERAAGAGKEAAMPEIPACFEKIVPVMANCGLTDDFGLTFVGMEKDAYHDRLELTDVAGPAGDETVLGETVEPPFKGRCWGVRRGRRRGGLQHRFRFSTRFHLPLG
jgi:hypothetical protein